VVVRNSPEVDYAGGRSTPIESAMWVRSRGSLVTIGAWYLTAVAITIASNTSAVPGAAQPHHRHGAIGRLVPDDVIGLIRYLRDHAKASSSR
jgi:hypothetical protein